MIHTAGMFSKRFTFILLAFALSVVVISCNDSQKNIKSQYFYTNTADILGKNIDEVSEKTGIDLKNGAEVYYKREDTEKTVLNEMYKYRGADVKIRLEFFGNCLYSVQFCFNNDDDGLKTAAKLCRELYAKYEKELGEPDTYYKFSKPMEEANLEMLKNESRIIEYWESSGIDWSEFLNADSNQGISSIDFSIKAEEKSEYEYAVAVEGYFRARLG